MIRRVTEENRRRKWRRGKRRERGKKGEGSEGRGESEVSGEVASVAQRDCVCSLKPSLCPFTLSIRSLSRPHPSPSLPHDPCSDEKTTSKRRICRIVRMRCGTPPVRAISPQKRCEWERRIGRRERAGEQERRRRGVGEGRRRRRSRRLCHKIN